MIDEAVMEMIVLDSMPFKVKEKKNTNKNKISLPCA